MALPRTLFINSATTEGYYGPHSTHFLPPRAEPALPDPFVAEEWAAELSALLPEGAAWPRGPGSTLQRVLAALAVELARLDGRGRALADEGDPRRTIELIADWERVLALPDACAPEAATIDDRRAAVWLRLLGVLDQSPASFVDLASRLGYAAVVDEFFSEQAALASGIPYSGDGWAHTWRMRVDAEVDATVFRAGAGRAGDPLRKWGIHMLECQVRRAKPAHTRVLFSYTSHTLLVE